MGCPGQCKCLQRRHSDHKLLVWGVKGLLKPPRNKRPDQFRWKLGDLLSVKEKQATYTQTGVDRQVLAQLVVDAPSMTTTCLEAAIRAELEAIANASGYAKVKVPVEGRVKAHTWRVTKLYRAKRRAGLALKRARTAGSELRIAECTASFQAASKLFNKVKGTEVRKMFQRSMEEEAAKGLPELSKKAHQAFKGLTGATSKHDGLGDVATWHPPLVTKQARGHTDSEVGALVSEYTRTISSTDTSPGEFDEDFGERVSGMVQHLSGDEDLQGFNAGRDMVEPPSHQEVAYALKTLIGPRCTSLQGLMASTTGCWS